jgi:hypothetical protein
VIDGGPFADVPLELLDRYVDTIVALIVSHNDADHHRGACQIIDEYWKTIECIFLLEDRPIDRIGLYQLAKRRRDEGVVKEIQRLERTRRATPLFEDSTSGLALDVLYPEFSDNLDARQSKEPNATSAILLLYCGARRVLFPGDSTLDAWHRLHRRLGGPVYCDVMAVPHHGGVIWNRVGGPADKTSGEPLSVAEELEWLYREAIVCRNAVISVGTSDTYNHPRRAVIQAIRAGQKSPAVLCTQITRKCCDADGLRRLGAGVLTPNEWSASHKDGGEREARGVACAGTVVVKIGPDDVRVERLGIHQESIDSLKNEENFWWHPVCRR